LPDLWPVANLDVLGTQWAVALSGSILPLRSERINKRAIWLEVVTINAIPMTQQFELNRSVLFSCTFMSRHSTTSFPKKKALFLCTLVHTVMVTFLVSTWSQLSRAEWCLIMCQLCNSLPAQYRTMHDITIVVTSTKSNLINTYYPFASEHPQPGHQKLKP